MNKFVFRNSELATDGWQVVVDNSLPDWRHTGLRVGTCAEGAPLFLESAEVERLILVLQGEKLLVEYSTPTSSLPQTAELSGRESVFQGLSDYLYLPSGSSAVLVGNSKVAVAEAASRASKPAKLISKSEVPVFVRGAGRESREVHDIASVGSLDADRFVVVEVIVPAGNWSGIPPHKHDVFVEGVESNLEEIYYFESAVSLGYEPPVEADPKGFIKAYASDSRPIDVNTEVRSGDVVLIPHGWHGPVMAHPGYDLYFLNVMAGPDPERSWNITEDPAHSWIRKTWLHQDADPRLPFVAE